MKLIEALQLLQKADSSGPELAAYLVCGFTPLHLSTFVAAELQHRNPQRRVKVQTGLYGDFLGSLERSASADANCVAVVLEWPDLDPRLGVRSACRWTKASWTDVVANVNRTTERSLQLISGMPHVPVAVSLPTLALPPLSVAPTWQATGYDLALREAVARFACCLAQLSNVRLVSAQHLDRVSPIGGRWDVRSELQNGFPYHVNHASVLAELLVRLLAPQAPKKGLITDLDDSLWKGILGEAGVQAVTWELDQQARTHGLYQQLLGSLAEAGVLLGIATKNDPALVHEALLRSDLLCPGGAFFPVEAHWGAKSESVRRILEAWNIAAEDVLFVDDSPLELAEVQAAVPGIGCLRFPKESATDVFALIEQLRDAFGKDRVSEEDGVRRESLRVQAQVRQKIAEGSVSADEFLKSAEAELSFSYAKEPLDPRALELINKTNQFNLNGKRFTDPEWVQYVGQPDSFLMIASYTDKYGPLGKIGVLVGRCRGSRVTVECWVMSCRAFSRRIEHQCLRQLYGRFNADEVILEFQPTPRNGPLQEFLAAVRGSSASGAGQVIVPASMFAANCPPLFHKVTN